MKLYGNTKLVFLSGYRNLDEKKILMIKDTKPLTGIRVLDIACFIAAPYAATIMGEFGADVIKVEHPNGGDPWRRYGARTNLPDQSLAWLNEARNKRSITLDLSKKEGAEVLKKLIKTADVVCENFCPGTLEKWTRSFPREKIIDVCTRNGVPAGSINSIADIFEDGHIKAREAIKYLKVPGVGDVAVPNVFPTLSETPGTIDNLDPGLGDHNKDLYREELGLSDSELQSLKESGVI